MILVKISKISNSVIMQISDF